MERQQVNGNAEIAKAARDLMEEALRLLDLADEGLAACHLAEAIDALGYRTTGRLAR